MLHESTKLKFAEALRAFWRLVRAKRLDEDRLQRFLHDHPRFLLGSRYTYLYEKLRLENPDGKLLIPDFVTVLPDRSFDLVELKRADLKRFIVGPPRRERFSNHVAGYLQQAREYKRWFQEARNRERFQDTYGSLRLRVLQPEVTLIVGRREELAETATFKRLRGEVQDIHIKTYTELYEEADLMYQGMTGM